MMNKSNIIHAISALVLAILATLLIEHSSLDLTISNWFYVGAGHWLIDKTAVLSDLIFYTLPKRLLLLVVIYLVLAWAWRYWQNKQPACAQKYIPLFKSLNQLSTREIGYLCMAMIAVPSLVATLKAITHVPCPVSLRDFGGQLAYLSLQQDITQHLSVQCFPAAHASAGFALYALAFIPSLVRASSARFMVISLIVTLTGWIMGGYKMAIGDHFFSHTLVSMLLAWAVASGVAWVMFNNKNTP